MVIKLETHENNRQKCVRCGRIIPKQIQRINFEYSTSYGGTSYNRVCALCIKQLYQDINKKELLKWEKQLVLKAI